MRHLRQVPVPNNQSGPEKIAQSLMHHNVAIVGNRITRFTPICSEIN